MRVFKKYTILVLVISLFLPIFRVIADEEKEFVSTRYELTDKDNNEYEINIELLKEDYDKADVNIELTDTYDKVETEKGNYKITAGFAVEINDKETGDKALLKEPARIEIVASNVLEADVPFYLSNEEFKELEFDHQIDEENKNHYSFKLNEASVLVFGKEVVEESQEITETEQTTEEQQTENETVVEENEEEYDGEYINWEESENEQLLDKKNLQENTLMALGSNALLAQPSPVASADGISIDNIDIKWKSSSTGSSQPAGHDDLILKPSGAIIPNQQWQLTFSISGKGRIAAGDIEIIIPAYIWMKNGSKEAGILTLGVPEMPGDDGAFAWKRVDDKIIITNVKTISAATKKMIEGTFRMTYPDPNVDVPFDSARAYELPNMVDENDEIYSYYKMYPGSNFRGLNATINLVTPFQRETITTSTETIYAGLKTYSELVEVNKSAVTANAKTGSKVYLTLPSNIPAELIPANPEDYYYVRWAVSGIVQGNSLTQYIHFDDEADDQALNEDTREYFNLEGQVLLGTVINNKVSKPIEECAYYEYDYDIGEDICQEYYTEPADMDVPVGTDFGVRKTMYVWMAYPKNNFEDGVTYTLQNTARGTLNYSDYKEASATASFRTPVTYKIDKVWEDNGYVSAADIKPTSTPVWIKSDAVKRTTNYGSSDNAHNDILNDDNNWHTEWTDDGSVMGYKAYEYSASITDSTHGFNGTSTPIVSQSIGPRVYLPDGSSYQTRGWWDHRTTVYDRDTHTWTFYNDYHEGNVWTYPSGSEKKIYDGRHSASKEYDIKNTNKDINLLRDGQPSTKFTYQINDYRYLYRETAREGADCTNPADMNKRNVTIEIIDGNHVLSNGRRLTDEDYYLSSFTFRTHNTSKWVPDGGWTTNEREKAMPTGVFQSVSNDEVKLYGLTNGEWKHYATKNSSGDITVYNGATVSGSTVYFSGTDVKEVKTSLTTNNAYVAQKYNVGFVLLPSEANKNLATQLLSLHDYASFYEINSARAILSRDGSVLNQTTMSDSAYFYGYDVKLAVDLDKASSYIKNDKNTRNFVFKNELTLNQWSNSQIFSDYAYAIESGDISMSKKGTFYDLLPVGMMVEAGSVKAEKNVKSIDYVNIIDNYKDSGRQLLIVEATLGESNETISSKNSNYPENHATTRNYGTYYGRKHTISFTMAYPYDEAYSRGFGGIYNYAAYEADEEEFGNYSGWTGERDNPSGAHAESINATSGVRDLMTDLDPESDRPSFVYAKALARITEIDFKAMSSLEKDVALWGETEWSNGHKDEAVVQEGDKYMYRLKLTSGVDTTTKDIVIFDNLDSYKPIRITDNGDSDEFEVGDLVSENVFEEVNEFLRQLNRREMQGEPVSGWKGELLDINVAELRMAGVDPVIYYSEQSIDLSVYKGTTDRQATESLNDTSLWTTVAPADLSKVKTIAVDCRKNNEGEDFELGSLEEIILYIYMKSPTYSKQPDAFDPNDYDDFTKNAKAFNSASMDITQQTNLSSTHGFVTSEYTKVGIKGSKLYIKKVWDDFNDNDRVRPESVSVKIYKNNEPFEELVIGAEDNWEKYIDHAIFFDENGNRIKYTASEEPVQDYTSSNSMEGNTITLTNKHELYKIDVPFSKTWDSYEQMSDDDLSKYIPSSVTIKLLANGEYSGISTSVRPDENGKWEGIFRNVTKLKDGVPIEYTFEERPVKDFIVEYDYTNNEIKNIYYPFGDLKVSKKVENVTQAIEGKEFTFNIQIWDLNKEETDREFDYIKSDGTTGKIKSGDSFTLKDGENLLIKSIHNDWTYKVTEKEEPGFRQVLAENDEGAITSNPTQEASFTNVYSSVGYITLDVRKELMNKPLKRAYFRFNLFGNGQTWSAVNSENGTVEFGRLTFTHEDDGEEFVYTASEVNDEKPGYTYDTEIKTIKVTPTDNGDGTMSVVARYYDSEDNETASAVFRNEYHAEGEAIIKAWKEIDGLDLVGGEFVFELFDENNEPVLDENGQPMKATNKADGSIVFDPIKYTEQDVNENSEPYIYYVKEITGDNVDVNYDKEVFGYSVKVLDNNDGTLSISYGNATPVRGLDGDLDFNFKYAVSVYGIGVDTLRDERKAGLTIGPALGDNYYTKHVEHTPTGETSSGNPHRCIHNDAWEQIINWNNEDPFVYEQCLENGCTHGINLNIPEYLYSNFYYNYANKGDGLTLIESIIKPEYRYWNPFCEYNVSVPQESYYDNGTVIFGWSRSNIRYMLNGGSVTGYYNRNINQGAYATIQYNQNQTLLSAFPEVLQQAMGERKTVASYPQRRTGEYDILPTGTNICYDKLFLLAQSEMFPKEYFTGRYENYVFENELNNSIGMYPRFRYITDKSAYTNYVPTGYYGIKNSWLREPVNIADEKSISTRPGGPYYQMRRYYKAATYNTNYSRPSYSALGYADTINTYGVSPLFVLDRNVTVDFDENDLPITGWIIEETPLPVFENNLKDGILSITKTTVDSAAADSDKQFSFNVKLVGNKIEDGELSYTLSPSNETKTVNVVNGEFDLSLKAGETATFNSLPALTTYEITEDIPDDWILNNSDKTTGTIQPNVTADASFENKYVPGSVSVQIKASKTLDGDPAKKDQFTFELVDSNETVVQEVKNGDGGTIEFKPIVYQLSGDDTSLSYTYKIREKNPNDSTIDWDEHEETVTVTIVNDNGTITKNVEYDNDGAVFANKTYPGILKISKTTNITTDANKGDQFTVRLTLRNKKGIPFANGEVIEYRIENASGESTDNSATVNNGYIELMLKADETAVFETLPVGTLYDIDETSIPAGWKLDSISKTSGTITANVTDESTIRNIYSANGYSNIAAHKRLVGRDPVEGEFSFELLDEDKGFLQKVSNSYMDRDEFTIDDQGNSISNPWFNTSLIWFDDIEYTLDDIGEEFVYYIREIKGNDEEITYDDEKLIKVTVNVEDAGAGNLKVDVSYDQDPLFVNTMEPGILSIQKNAPNNTNPDKTFKFKIKFDSDISSVIEAIDYDEYDNQAVLTKVEGEANTYEFELAPSEKAYIYNLPNGLGYEITEVESAGWSLTDSSNTSGTITANDLIEASFTNTYEASGSVSIDLTKVLYGDTLEDSQFSFEMRDSMDSLVQTVSNDANGRATFTINYFMENVGREYRYYISEVNDGRSYVFDPHTVEVIVKVKDNYDGTLGGDITYNDILNGESTQTDSVKFINTSKTFINVEKIWDHGDNQKLPDKITVRLLANDEEIDSAIITANSRWKHSFENLPEYDQDGNKINYMISEDRVNGYETNIEKTDDGFIISNTYKEELVTEELTVKKVWDDKNDFDRIRPEYVEVQLYSGDEIIGDPIRLDESNNWTYTFTELNKDMPYKVKEVRVPEGYSESVVINDDTVTITNTHTPEPDDTPPQEFPPNKPPRYVIPRTGIE